MICRWMEQLTWNSLIKNITDEKWNYAEAGVKEQSSDSIIV